MALKIISEKLANSKSAIVNNALEYYFKNQFPEALPKSEGEIIMKVREKLETKKILNEFNLDDFIVRSVIGFEEELKEEEEQLDVIRKKINTVDEKLKQKKYQNNEEKRKLLENKEELQDGKKFILESIEDTKRYMKETKRRTRSISMEESYKIIEN